MTEAEQWRKLLELSDDAGTLEVCRAFERLVPELASDLAPWPFYAMPTSALPPAFGAASKHTGGWYQAWAHLWLKPYLPHYNDRPGPACIVHDEDWQADESARLAAAYCWWARGETVAAEEFIDFIPRADAVEKVCGTLAHELGHAVESVVSGEFEEWGIDMFEGGPDQVLFNRLVARKEEEAEPPPPQMACHDLRFTRIVAHLDYRLRQLGVCSTALGLSCAGTRFGQRPYDDCYAALGNEPADCRGLSFRKLLALPMPLAFQDCALAADRRSP